jgi:hypothetical protein
MATAVTLGKSYTLSGLGLFLHKMGENNNIYLKGEGRYI